MNILKFKSLNKLVESLIKKKIKLVSVESCTGGWIGKATTDLSGSSQWFEAGFITYSNEAKTRLVNVSSELLEIHGAVSIPVAEAMAKGALTHFPDAISVAVTGVAGPEGGTIEKPVGMVCIACSYKNYVISKRFDFNGDRGEVRQQTVESAFKLVLETLGKI